MNPKVRENKTSRNEIQPSLLESAATIIISPYILPTVVRSVKDSDKSTRSLAAFISGMSALAQLRSVYLNSPTEYLFIPLATNVLSLAYEAGRYALQKIREVGGRR